MTRQEITPHEAADLRRRVDELGAEVARLRRTIHPDSAAISQPWWRAVAGRFDGDPVFEEVVKAGRAWRVAQRPRVRGGRART